MVTAMQLVGAGQDMPVTEFPWGAGISHAQWGSPVLTEAAPDGPLTNEIKHVNASAPAHRRDWLKRLLALEQVVAAAPPELGHQQLHVLHAVARHHQDGVVGGHHDHV
jgi:hypothetical protein